MDISFDVAKQFCEDYHKDQCIILSWDKSSGETWVTTYGVGDENSIQATNAGKILKDYLKLQRENDMFAEALGGISLAQKPERYVEFTKALPQIKKTRLN